MWSCNAIPDKEWHGRASFSKLSWNALPGGTATVWFDTLLDPQIFICLHRVCLVRTGAAFGFILGVISHAAMGGFFVDHKNPDPCAESASKEPAATTWKLHHDDVHVNLCPLQRTSKTYSNLSKSVKPWRLICPECWPLFLVRNAPKLSEVSQKQVRSYENQRGIVKCGVSSRSFWFSLLSFLGCIAHGAVWECVLFLVVCNCSFTPECLHKKHYMFTSSPEFEVQTPFPPIAEGDVDIVFVSTAGRFNREPSHIQIIFVYHFKFCKCWQTICFESLKNRQWSRMFAMILFKIYLFFPHLLWGNFLVFCHCYNQNGTTLQLPQLSCLPIEQL